MTNQLLLGIAVVAVALLIAYELIETWRWQGLANRPPSRFRVIRGIRGAIGGLVGIVTMRRFRRPKPEPVTPLTDDDLARRLGDAPPGPIHIHPGRIVVSGARVPPPHLVQPVVPIPPVSAPRPSRLRLARDMIGAALVMAGFVVVFANVMSPITERRGDVLGETATPAFSIEVRTAVPVTPEPSPATATSPDPIAGPSTSPDGTGLASATATPTLAPRKTDKPAAEPRPTPAPTAAPTSTPRPTPKPTKRPTPTPKPAARITAFDATPASPAVNDSVTFSYGFSNGTGCAISFDDGSGLQACPASGGSGSIAHSYDTAGTYHVVVTIDGPGGSDSAAVTITVADAAP